MKNFLALVAVATAFSSVSYAAEPTICYYNGVKYSYGAVVDGKICSVGGTWVKT